jgi:3-oxoacyl-[acyl-carrier-protein] synthase II
VTPRDQTSVPPATILGVGAITPLGRNLIDISRNLESPSQPSSPIALVKDDWLADPSIARSMRRADRFVRMAAIAALDAWNAAGETWAAFPREQIGLIVTSGLGPHVRGFKFLDGILDAGDSEALPTDFSHSVHGAAASYIAGLLDLRGPSLTTTDFEIGFEQAILLAQCWLDQQICRRVLVGAVEEIGQTMLGIVSQALQGKPPIQLGEGAVFLLLGPTEIDGFARLDASQPPAETDLLLLDDPPLPGVESPAHRPAARNTASFTPFFGQTAAAGAFQLLGAFLSMKSGKVLGTSINSDVPAAFDNATMLRTSCGRAAALRLSRIQRNPNPK